jgi:uncharacterized Zn finger protein
VQALAGARSFERGQLYAASGRVGKRVGTDGSVTAKVLTARLRGDDRVMVV